MVLGLEDSVFLLGCLNVTVFAVSWMEYGDVAKDEEFLGDAIYGQRQVLW